THDTAAAGPATVLGQLVHNPVVQSHLDSLGLERGHLEAVGSSRTERVIITAHGAADRHRDAWRRAGHLVTDTTCPLVKKAHHALAQLVAAGCQPVVIGQPGHVEVRGLCGDFPEAVVVETPEDLERLPPADKFGVISQTTQPLAKVLSLVGQLQRLRPDAEVIFRDTVCQPTKDRQTALEALCAANELVVVIGGRNSNNTRQLTETVRSLGNAVRQVETADDLQAEWFRGLGTVGVTAGTSTLDETVQAVMTRLKQFAAEARTSRIQSILTSALS
ncbi:MAG: 4-hydroxy-3-methylbut-2-enyl diphosphate reductase, partial [Verrucomicrobiaceae bacterium]